MFMRMPAFVYRLIAPRPTFPVDMSEQERATLAEHGRYWKQLMEDGKAIAFGPVNDPAGSYGLGLLIADDLAEAQALRDADPAILAPHGLRAEIAPMLRLVTPTGVYEAR
jgi:uncharacterized protein YciI